MQSSSYRKKVIIDKSEIDSPAAFNQIYYLPAPSPILLAVKCPTLNTLRLLYRIPS